MDYYKILEISPDASTEVISMAYKALVKKYHPDSHNDNKEFYSDKLKSLNEAFEVLSDPEKRVRYDMTRNMQKINQQNQMPNYDNYAPSNQNHNHYDKSKHHDHYDHHHNHKYNDKHHHYKKKRYKIFDFEFDFLEDIFENIFSIIFGIIALVVVAFIVFNIIG